MVFVHSRMDTLKTAKRLTEIASQRQQSEKFNAKKVCPDYGRWVKEVEKARSPQIKELFQLGCGMHHAGLLRSDRSLTEKLFICCNKVKLSPCKVSTIHANPP